jgi:hypothetical protein
VLKRFLKQLFCKHVDTVPLTHLFGELAIEPMPPYKRILKCVTCHKLLWKV